MLASNDLYPWYTRRTILHFDYPPSLSVAKAVVTNPAAIKRHAFLPLITASLDKETLGKDEDNQPIKKIKSRQVFMASHLDELIYRYYLSVLRGAHERQLAALGLNDAVLAFRSPGRSNVECAALAFNAIRELGDCCALAFDITKFFNNIRHDQLKIAWCKILGVDALPDDHYALFRSLSRFAWVEQDTLNAHPSIVSNQAQGTARAMRLCSASQFREVVRAGGMIQVNRKGCEIPQGISLTPVLSNIVMLEFDQAVHAAVRRVGGRYFRYCDDILCLVAEDAREEISQLVADEVKKLGLELNQGKTEVRHFHRTPEGQFTDKPLQYLGFTYDGRHTLIRSSTFIRFRARMTKAVRLAKLTKIKHNNIRRASGQTLRKLYKRKLYRDFSHLGRRNFVQYALKASRTMNSAGIRKQAKSLWQRLHDLLKKA